MRLVTAILLAASCTAAYANVSPYELAFMSSAKKIAQLKQQLQQLSSKVDIPVAFPRSLPAASPIKYLQITNNDQQSYTINLSDTPDCDGAHACTLGSVSAERGGNPTINYDNENQEVTTPVFIGGNIKAYYTKSYALGSSFPGQIAFRCNETLFTITWQDNDDQLTLTHLAEAMLQNATGKPLRCR